MVWLANKERFGGMTRIIGIDHVAITVSDMEASCAFYRDLFGARTVNEYAPKGKTLLRQIAIGDAQFSIHQAGNGVSLVAQWPTVGAADICLRWSSSIENAVALLRGRRIEIIEGPTPRRTADGLPSQSVFFRDPDGNLLEIMAADLGEIPKKS
jgi:catechol 2,3-dioxygenase-like lactoylglutathione lyase family enzyme